MGSSAAIRHRLFARRKHSTPSKPVRRAPETNIAVETETSSIRNKYADPDCISRMMPFGAVRQQRTVGDDID
jgi:hypothetical protein